MSLPRPVEWHIRRCERLESVLWSLMLGSLVINIMSAVLFGIMVSEFAVITLLATGGACWAARRAKEWTKILRWETASGRRNLY